MVPSIGRIIADKDPKSKWYTQRTAKAAEPEAGYRKEAKLTKIAQQSRRANLSSDRPRVEVEVVDAVPAGVRDRDIGRTSASLALSGLEAELLDTDSHGNLEYLDTSLDGALSRGLRARLDVYRPSRFGHGGHENDILDHLPSGWFTPTVVGSVALGRLQVRSVPVDEHLLVDDWRRGTSLEGLDVRDREVEHGSVVQSFGPFGRSVICVGSVVWADVMGF